MSEAVSVAQATALVEVGDGVLEAQVPQGWGQGRAVFGGLVAALAHAAMARVLEQPLPLCGLSVSFVAPLSPGPVRLAVAVLRAGRALAQLEVRLQQGGTLCAVVQGAYGPERPTAVAVTPPPPPEAPAPDTLPELPYLEGITPDFTQRFEYRWIAGGLPFSGAAEAAYTGWIRPRAPEPIGLEALLAMLDAWPCPALALADRPVPASSALWLVRLAAQPPAGGWPAGTWARFEARTLHAAGGHADQHATLWDAQGRLLASSTQVMVEFSGRDR